MRTYDTPLGKFPSVTEVLGLKDKSGPLMGWAVKMGAEASSEFLTSQKGSKIDDLIIETVFNLVKTAFRKKQQTALDTGSKTHNAIEVFTKAPSRKVGLKLVHALKEYKEIELPFGAFLKWHDDVSFELIQGEHPIWSGKYRYAGTLDAIAMVNGKRTLVDYKASKAIRDDYLWQVGAYDVAYEEMSNDKLESFGCLRLDKITGLPEWKKWTREDTEEGFKKFCCLLELWWLENGRKLCKK